MPSTDILGHGYSVTNPNRVMEDPRLEVMRENIELLHHLIAAKDESISHLKRAISIQDTMIDMLRERLGLDA